MVRVTILAGEADELVGEFEFENLPRKDEDVVVPWNEDPEGFRIFTVVQVNHVAFGTKSQWGVGPRTVLRYCEEIS